MIVTILALAGSLSSCGAPLAPARSTTAVALPATVVTPATAVVPTRAPTRIPLPTTASTAALTPTPLAPDAVLVGAGDMANCDPNGAEATAKLLDRIDGRVVTLGDHAYPNGTVSDFNRCYEPTWGRHKARTRPAPGNHDYHTPGAAAYYAYFGENAGPAGRGYYSYDLGAWRIIVLNSHIAAGSDSDQAAWLRADLAANPAACTLAYWHAAVFSSGAVHGNDTTMKALWDILAEAGGDIVLAAHEHTYERFAPQTSSGQAGPNGIRQFVVGTGGAGLYAFGQIQPNSEARSNDSYGVLKLTLRVSSYDREFVPVDGGTFHDSGSAACVSSAASSRMIAP